MDHPTDALKQRLASQMSRGELVLFLGAGFSLDARDRRGEHLPSSLQLTKELWQVAFPGVAFDTHATLGDTFHCASENAKHKLDVLLRRRLSVDPDGVPEYYCLWLSMPWHRCYTLNVDDLEVAVQQVAQLPRRLESKSAVSTDIEKLSSAPSQLEVVHLNGMLGDPVEMLTFSERDYGIRLSTPDPWLLRASADMTGRPVVYVGTELHEPTLWQHIEGRASRGGRNARELRPGSYLVIPELARTRQILLKRLNVDWIPMSAQEFANSWLANMGAAKEDGFRTIAALTAESARQGRPQLVSELLQKEKGSGGKEYLLGQQPIWGDLLSERAIRRDCDQEIYTTATRCLAASEACPPLVITGTAGVGKSTALMRLALRLNGEGIPTYWIDERTNLDPYVLRRTVADATGPVAVLVDDADLWGRTLTKWAIELPNIRPNVLFVVALRASRIDAVLDPRDLSGVEPIEIVIPLLSDRDIHSLLDVLDRENRLGVLKGKSDAQRVAAFRRQAGRQLLVAMIQATSGRRFGEKVFEEFRELQQEAQFIYGIVCVVSSQRYTIDRSELLLACGKSDNSTLNAIEALHRRHLIVRDTRHAGYAARHRVVAEELLRNAEFSASLGPMVKGIVFAFASHVDPRAAKQDRRWRRLIRFMNHDYLMRIMVDVADVRDAYEGVEQLLSHEHHYWLQRGSMEVEEGDLALATNFLEQARSLGGTDRLVENEYAYLLMKKAISNPRAQTAPAQFEDGLSRLEGLIGSAESRSPHPYHVLGSQVLAWVRRANLPTTERSRLLGAALGRVKAGVARYPRSEDLRSLGQAIETEWLSTAVTRRAEARE